MQGILHRAELFSLMFTIFSLFFFDVNRFVPMIAIWNGRANEWHNTPHWFYREVQFLIGIYLFKLRSLYLMFVFDVFDSLNIPGMLNTVQVSRALIMTIESRPNVDGVEGVTKYNSANICLIKYLSKKHVFYLFKGHTSPTSSIQWGLFYLTMSEDGHDEDDQNE